MLALSEIDLAKLTKKDLDGNGIDGRGIEDVMKGISHTTNRIAKGSAFQLIAINAAQKAGKTIKGIEAQHTVTIRGKALRSRLYDYIEELGGQITHVECKAWLPGNVASLVKRSLKGTTKHGEQLMVDLLDWQRKGFTGNRWEFDSQEAVDTFKSSVTDILKSDNNVREVMSGHLGIDVKDFNDEFLEEALEELDNFVEAVI